MKKGIVYKILWIVTLFISSLLLIVYLSPFISPRTFVLPSILNLFYLPLLALLLITMVIAFLFKYKKIVMFSLLILIAGINHHHHTFSIKSSECSKNKKSPIRLMTYNVKVFNLYNWVKNVQYKKKIIHLIDSIKPDILCLQEYVYDDRKIFDTRDTILKLLKYKYYSETFLQHNKYFHFGMALFSRYPIINTKKIVFNSSLNFVTQYKIILPGQDTVCLFNTHFQSIRFSYDEYKYLDSLQKNIEENKIRKFFPITDKIIKANRMRAGQADYIAKIIDKCPYKTILCGDFNDIPCSYSYNLFSDKMKDAFLYGGTGLGATFNRFFIPYRIDFAFLPKDFDVCNAEVIRKSYSDHYPLVVNFKP